MVAASDLHHSRPQRILAGIERELLARRICLGPCAYGFRVGGRVLCSLCRVDYYCVGCLLVARRRQRSTITSLARALEFFVDRRVSCRLIDQFRFREVPLPVARASLFHFRAIVECGCGPILSTLRLCDRPRRHLDETRVAAMDIAGRGPAFALRLAIANQRSGVFQPIQFLPSRSAVGYLRFRFRVGKFLRLVLATCRSSLRLIDLYMLLDAPRRDDFERLPRFADSAAPAAICCFFDFAGIAKLFRCSRTKWIYEALADLRHKK